jgi:hypothetical protein
MEADIRNVHVERYYPDVLSNAKEFKVIASIENPEFTKVWTALWKQFLNTFVYSLDEDGATRWESMLKLHISPFDTLSTRKKRILAKINSSLPYTERNLQSMLDGIHGTGNVKTSVEYDKYTVWAEMIAPLLLKSAGIRTFLRAIIPANMGIGISNTQTSKLNMYVGARVQSFKHLVIRPSITFSIADDSTIEYFYSGEVKRMNHFTLRS